MTTAVRVQSSATPPPSPQKDKPRSFLEFIKLKVGPTKKEMSLGSVQFASVTKGVQEIRNWCDAHLDFAKTKLPSRQTDLVKLYERILKCGKKAEAGLEKHTNYSLLNQGSKVYILFFPFAKGGDKEAYLGIDAKSGETVVISKLSSQTSTQAETARFKPDTFNRLKELSKGKNEGGLVPLYDLINVGDAQFVAQKWCKEDCLINALESSQLSDQTKKVFVEDLFKGVLLLLEEGLLHKDVKPENFYVHEGHVYLGDLDSVQQECPMTFGYAAPENLMGGEFTEKSLVWSLGLTLHVLLTGKQAEVSFQLSEMLAQVGQEQIQECLSKMEIESFTPYLPWEKTHYTPQTKGEALVARMLRANPEDRCTLAEAYTEFLGISVEEISFEAVEAIESEQTSDSTSEFEESGSFSDSSV